MKQKIKVLLLLLVATVTVPAFADKLLIIGIGAEPPNSVEGVPRPNPGMTSSKVTEIFGHPKAKSETVGTPPITKWVYDKFVVVFEYDKVIRSVVTETQFSDLNN